MRGYTYPYVPPYISQQNALQGELQSLTETLRKNTGMMCLLPEDGRLSLTSSLFPLNRKGTPIIRQRQGLMQDYHSQRFEQTSLSRQALENTTYYKEGLEEIIQGLGDWWSRFDQSYPGRRNFVVLDHDPFTDITLRYFMTGIIKNELAKFPIKYYSSLFQF